jgi:hypothetical protein
VHEAELRCKKKHRKAQLRALHQRYVSGVGSKGRELLLRVGSFACAKPTFSAHFKLSLAIGEAGGFKFSR